MENNYLAHYGTLGQKWGLRRWQNYDGSLTPAGREHYGVGAPIPSEPKTPKERTALADQVRKQYKKRGGEHHTVAADIVFHKVKKSAKAYIDAKKKLENGSSNAKQDSSKFKEAAKKAEADYNADVRDWVNKCVGKHGNEVISNKWESKRMSDALGDTIKDEYLKAEVNDRVYDAFFKDSITKNGKKQTESLDEFVKSYEEKIKTDKSFAKEFSREYYEHQRENARKVAKSQKELDKIIEILDREEKVEGFKVNDPYYLRNAILDLKGGERRKTNKKLAHNLLSNEEDHLEHHGILGQKWGKQNGPPYPLDRDDHSAEEKKLNKFTPSGVIARYKEKKEEKRKAAEKAARVQKMKEGKERKAAERKAAEEHEAAKQKALKSGNPEEVAKFKDELSYAELNEAINRIDLENRLKAQIVKANPPQESAQVDDRSRLEKTTAFISKYGKMASNVAEGAEGMIRAYNTVAKVMNSVTDSDWPTIKEIDPKTKLAEREKKAREAEERERKDRVDKLVRSGDVEEINRRKSELTNDELSNAVKRLDNEERLDRKAKTKAYERELDNEEQETSTDNKDTKSEENKPANKEASTNNAPVNKSFSDLVSRVMKDREEGKDYDDFNPDLDALNALERRKSIRYSKRR